LASCGGESELEVQELKLRFAQLESDVKELKSAHQAELDSIKKRVDDQSKRMLMLGSISAEKSEPSGTSILRTKEVLRQEAHRNMMIQRANREENKAAAVIRQLFRSHSVDDITRILNEQKMKTSSGKSYTRDLVLALIKEHDMERSLGKSVP
jgi:hypothetical protein